LFGSALTDAVEDKIDARGLSVRELQEDFEASLFELVATEEQDDFGTGDTLGVGVEFPESGVYVDWNVGAWPEDERLDGPHVSQYATLDDAQTVAQGEIRELSGGREDAGCRRYRPTPPHGVQDARENAEGNENGGVGYIRSQELSRAEEWEAALLEMHQRMHDKSGTRLLDIPTEFATPEFVKERIRDTILSGTLFGDIEAISSSDRTQLREFLTESLTDEGWTIDGVADQIEQLGVDTDRARTIARTETTEILNTARETGYEEQGLGDDDFYWSGSISDGRTTNLCRYLIGGIDAVDNDVRGNFSNLKRPDGTNPSRVEHRWAKPNSKHISKPLPRPIRILKRNPGRGPHTSTAARPSLGTFPNPSHLRQ